MSEPLELVFVLGDSDAECCHCGDMFEIASIATYLDGSFVCPPCAETLSPGFEQIVRGLSLVCEALTLDQVNLLAVTRVLRHVATIGEQLHRGERQVRVRFELVPDHFGGDSPIGVLIDRSIVPALPFS